MGLYDLSVDTDSSSADPRPWLSWLAASNTTTTTIYSILKLWAISFLSSIPITFFFYMDQNISSLLCQLPAMGLTRGRYFHLSFFAMGSFCAIGPLFGLPFVTGSLPHSPQFVRALTSTIPTSTTTEQPSTSTQTASSSSSSKTRLHVAENRLAPLITYTLMATPLLAPSLLSPIPEAAIDGVLAYVGVEGILGTMLWRRSLLLLSPPSTLPPRLREACNGAVAIHLYTLVQLLALAIVWAVNLSPAGLCVSFVIVSLVPFRERVMPRLFTPSALAALDDERALDQEVVVVREVSGEVNAVRSLCEVAVASEA